LAASNAATAMIASSNVLSVEAGLAGCLMLSVFGFVLLAIRKERQADIWKEGVLRKAEERIEQQKTALAKANETPARDFFSRFFPRNN